MALLRLVFVSMMVLGFVSAGCLNNNKIEPGIDLQVSADISPFAIEGDHVPIKLRFDQAVNGDVELEEYEFHYIMYPEIAPEPDTWPHKKQMDHMESVLNGETEPYAPSLDDSNIQKILETSPKKSYGVTKVEDGVYSLDWATTHGRIFFRLKVDGQYTDDLYTIRVHCNQIDMRSFERLKDVLEMMAMPMEHGNIDKVGEVSEMAYTIYTMGHSPRFMLSHHEYPVEDLDELFRSLEDEIEEGDLEGADDVREDILAKLVEKEDYFFSLDVEQEDGKIILRVEDLLTDFSFYDDPNTEVHVKIIDPEKESMERLAALHSPADENDHSHMNQPLDKEGILEGTLPMDRVDGSYQIELDGDSMGQELEVIVIHGPEQRYYLTRRITI